MSAADDCGIGPGNAGAILELGLLGRITAAPLLANFARPLPAIEAWKGDGKPMDMEWYPDLTLNHPLVPVLRCFSLVDRKGTFWDLHGFLMQVHSGQINGSEVESGLRQQLDLYRKWLGIAPC